MEPCERGCEWPIEGEVPGRAGVAPPKLAPPCIALLVLPCSGVARCAVLARSGVPRRVVEAEAGSRLPCNRLPCNRLPCCRPAAEEEGVSAGVSARMGARLRLVPNDEAEAEAEAAEAGGGRDQPVSRESCRAVRLVRVRLRVRLRIRLRITSGWGWGWG